MVVVTIFSRVVLFYLRGKVRKQYFLPRCFSNQLQPIPELYVIFQFES